MKHLIIIGARGFGREIYNSATESLGYGTVFKVKGFLDDKSNALDKFDGYPPIISSVEEYQVEEDDVFTCALGDIKYKEKYVNIILKKGGQFITLIHRDAYVCKMNTTVGIGCLILAGARIHCDATIGNFVTMQPYSIVGHDIIVGDWCHINAHAVIGGTSIIEPRVTLHTTSFIVPKSHVEEGATVGAGSVAMRRVKAGQTVFGVPAKPVIVPTIGKK